MLKIVASCWVMYLSLRLSLISSGSFTRPRGRSLVPVKDFSPPGHWALKTACFSVLFNPPPLPSITCIDFIHPGLSVCPPASTKIPYHVCVCIIIPLTQHPSCSLLCVSVMSSDSARSRVVCGGARGAYCAPLCLPEWVGSPEAARRPGSRVQGRPRVAFWHRTAGQAPNGWPAHELAPLMTKSIML